MKFLSGIFKQMYKWAYPKYSQQQFSIEYKIINNLNSHQ